MAVYGQLQFLSRNTFPIIDHFHQPLASFFDQDCDLVRPCVDGIFNQLFNYGRWSFYNLSSSDL